MPPSSFSKELSLPVICEALIKAAYDPRVKGVFVKIEPVTCGWAKLTEIRRHIEFFNASGKFSMAYMELGGEKEYYVASAFEEIYFAPSANIYLRGLTVSGKVPEERYAARLSDEWVFCQGRFCVGRWTKQASSPK